MQNNIVTVFNYKNYKLRTVRKDERQWFVLKDICNILGVVDSHQLSLRIDSCDKSYAHVKDCFGRFQNMMIVSEFGLFKILLRSSKPDAKNVMTWAMQRVFPKIGIQRDGISSMIELMCSCLLNRHRNAELHKTICNKIRTANIHAMLDKLSMML